MTRKPFLASAAVVVGLLALPSSSPAAVSCPNSNPVVDENYCKGPGTTDWQLQSYDATAVAGFATRQSYNRGSSVTLKLARAAGSGTINLRVYRMGYYGGTGGRLVHSANGIQVSNGTTCGSMNATTGLLNCNNWASAYTIPSSALPVSGIYLVRLIDVATGRDNHALFVVRDDSRQSQVLYKLPTATYAAYNYWGGKSLYTGLSQGANTISGSRRAVKVSFDRPSSNVHHENNWFLMTDYPLVYWLERQGYDVAYTESQAVHLNLGSLTTHSLLVLSGHDEYWSGEEFDRYKAARDTGVDIASFSANTAFWKVRYESLGDTLVCYKTVEGAGPQNGAAGANDWGPDGQLGTDDDALGADGKAGTSDDRPQNSTTTFRDNGAPPGDPNAPQGGRVGPDKPENSLFGVMFLGLNNDFFYPLGIPPANGASEFAGDSIWSRTGIPTNQQTTIEGNRVGFEWDAIPTQAQYTSRQPAGVKRLTESATQTHAGAAYLHDEGRVYGPAPPPGQSDKTTAVKYTAPSGARVFAAATNEWSWGLGPHYLDDPGSTNYQQPAIDSSDPRLQQATYNVISAAGVEPGTPSGVLIGANQSAPAPSFTVSPNPAEVDQAVTFDGSASSDPGGNITRYEWDLDDNGSFETDTGSTPTTSRSYDTPGDVAVKLRVSDNQGGQAPTTRTLTVSAPPPGDTYVETVLGTSGLKHYWRLGETSGSAFADSKGSVPATQSGAQLGAPGALAGDPNGAARFDGLNDFASANVDLSATSRVTLEFWLKWDAFANNDDLAFELTPTFNTNPGGFLVDPNESSSGKFELAHRQGSSFTGYNSSRLTRPTAAAWHHYALVFDKTQEASSELKAYVDGASVPLSNDFSNNTSDAFAQAPLYFMSRAGNSLNGAGVLDEVALYTRPLTATEVADHYRLGTSGGGNQPPAASFTISPNPATTGATVSFNGSASSDPDGSIAKYEWDLDGNGSFETDTGTTATASRSYPSAGTVDVGLRVTDNGGKTDETTRTLTVNNPPTSYEDAVLGTSGLVHYWRLGETSGSTFADSKGGASAGVAGASMGVPGAIAGDSNGAARFDGVNDFASANVNLSSTAVVTLEFWLKWDAFANNDDLAFELTPTFNTNPGGFLVDPNESASGKFELAHRHGSPFTGYNSGRFVRPTAGAWHHYVLVFDKGAPAANELTAYLDGAAVPLSHDFASENLDTFAQSTLYFMSRAGTSLFGGGDLDEVAIYTRALTTTEVADHHALGSG